MAQNFTKQGTTDKFNWFSEKVTYVPLLSSRTKEEIELSKQRKSASVLESLYWQAVGWVHTPPFITTKLDCDLKFKIPESSVEAEKYKFYTKKSFQPKLQIEDRVPYGALPRDVVSDIEKRRFAEQDLTTILDEMGIEKEAIVPTVLYCKDGIALFKENSEGIPQKPFLDLDMFDDASYYDIYCAEKWLALGESENGRKPLSAIAFVPKQEIGAMPFECQNFDWCKVMVLDYNAENKLYLVRRILGYPDNHNSICDMSDSSEMWIPRIYLKFDAEEPLRFAKRLQTALHSRHIVEESLRMSYYVECIPLEDSPDWPKEDVNAIIGIVRRSRPLQRKLQWIKDHLSKSKAEIQLEYKRAYNSICYMEIAKQNPCLIKDFKSERLIFSETNLYLGSKIERSTPFKEMFENFRCKTFYTCVEAVQALNLVEANILALRGMSLYNLSSKDIHSLEKFEDLQKIKLSNVLEYIHKTWLSEISNAVILNLKNCGKGPYDLTQSVLHTFKLTKLGKLLQMITFKMQDVIRFLIMESLEKYVMMFQQACINVKNVRDNFIWTDSLSSDQFSPQGNPVFEVPLEIKGDRLEFVTHLETFEGTVKNLFEQGLHVTKDLPNIEKFVMKKMLYNPDNKLDTVGEREKQIIAWKREINRGIHKAMIVAEAYVDTYTPLLKSLKIDQINYIKKFARKKVSCDHLKKVIEMHHTEKKKLEDTIPSFVDIGPFRLVTSSVRQAGVKKHEQLADAVLGYFYSKLRQYMEHINTQFLMLLDRIDQPTGNIEDLLDKKQWCRTVPKKIERICEDVNRLRLDVKLISTFYRNMDDDDFNTYWQIQKLPQETMKRLHYRISVFDNEKNQHREHLNSDQETLKTNLKIITQVISKFVQYSKLEKVANIATEVRKARKSLTQYDEQAQLFQKREKLFGLRITDYTEIEELSQVLIPYENFWLSAAEFYKYEERDDIELQAIDSSQLRETIEEFHSNLLESLEFFTEKLHPKIHKSVLKVLMDVEEFIQTRLPVLRNNH